MTEAQRIASTPEHSVWVVASAGTGKTKVLTDRVLRLLLSGVAPQKILCLTFTNAAATEMASRIQKKLGQWATLPETNLINELEQLMGSSPSPELIAQVRTLFAEILDTAEGLKIQTIHAFCQLLIKRFPLEANISSNAQLIDDVLAKELLGEAKSRLLRGGYKKDDSCIEDAIKAISWRIAELSFSELVDEIVGKGNQFAYLFQTYSLSELEAHIYEVMGATSDLTPEDIIAKACRDESFDYEGMKQATIILLGGSKQEVERGEIIAAWLSFDETARTEAIGNYTRAFLTQNGEPRKALLNKATTAKHPDIEQVLVQEQERIICIENTRKAQLCAILSTYILHIAEGILAIYRDLKSQRGFLDYNDLIFTATSLIKNAEASAWVLYKLDGGVDHILVDEAQDTSPAQWEIVDALSTEFFSGNGTESNGRSLFVVGDEKQSIYSFQGADPRKFQEMHDNFAFRVKQALQSWHSITLDRSFRSTEAILQAVDAIFSSVPLQQAISPSQAVQHTAHRKGQAGLVEVWQSFATEQSEELSPWPLPNQQINRNTASSLLANKIADTIDEWLKTERLLVSKNRPITAGDIMILVRRRNSFVDDMIRALKQRHIPVSGTDRLVLTEHIAIMDLIVLGKFLLLPQDDLNLATLLKTPLIGLNEGDLFTLAYQREQSLWESLKKKQHTTPEFQQAHDYLSSLLGITDFDTPFALFNHILDVLDGRRLLIGRLGYEVNDPLDEFLSLALTYQKNYTPSLQGFLRWIESSLPVIKRDMEQGADQVRVMTIHGSKGLQAPIIFLPDTMQAQGSKDKLLWSNGVPYWSGKRQNEHELFSAMRDAHNAYEAQEYYRLLYVALTRPEDELYICNYHGKNKPSDQSWYNVICNGFKSIATTFDAAEPGQPILRLESKQVVPLPTNNTNHKATRSIPPLPEYFQQPAKKEERAKKRVPSHSSDEVLPPLFPHHPATLRGILIHRLLEFLPTIPNEYRQTKVEAFLKSYTDEFTKDNFDALLADVNRVLTHPDYAFLFSLSSYAEVTVTGMINGKNMTGQIDRLVVTENAVWIIDYKTTVNPPEKPEDIPQAYHEQLALYRALIEPLYPGKEIKCAILWTRSLELMFTHHL